MLLAIQPVVGILCQLLTILYLLLTYLVIFIHSTVKLRKFYLCHELPQLLISSLQLLLVLIRSALSYGKPSVHPHDGFLFLPHQFCVEDSHQFSLCYSLLSCTAYLSQLPIHVYFFTVSRNNLHNPGEDQTVCVNPTPSKKN